METHIPHMGAQFAINVDCSLEVSETQNIYSKMLLLWRLEIHISLRDVMFTAPRLNDWFFFSEVDNDFGGQGVYWKT